MFGSHWDLLEEYLAFKKHKKVRSRNKIFEIDWKAKIPKSFDLGIFEFDGGGSEIRTHGGRKPSPVFKTGAFNHSTIPPWFKRGE